MEQLPSILALFGVFLTVLVNLVLGMIKTKAESKTVGNSAEKEFRDDLILQLDKSTISNDKKDVQVSTLQETVAKLLEENLTLRLDNKQLKHTNDEYKNQLDEINKKVYYIKNNTSS